MVILQNRRKAFRQYTVPGITTSYSNSGGSGDRTGIITIDQAPFFSGIPGMVNTPVMIDGLIDFGASYFNSYAVGYMYDGWWLSFDFGTNRIIDEMKWYQQTSATHGTWKLQGSIDNLSWFDIGSTFLLGGFTTQTITEISSNTTAYRYYRIYLVTGPSSSIPYIYELEFKIY